MSPRPIIEDFNVIKGGAPGLCSCLKGLAINAFTFETVKEAFHGCIIVTLSSTAHARHHALLLQKGLIVLTRVGAPTIRVME